MTKNESNHADAEAIVKQLKGSQIAALINELLGEKLVTGDSGGTAVIRPIDQEWEAVSELEARMKDKGMWETPHMWSTQSFEHSRHDGSYSINCGSLNCISIVEQVQKTNPELVDRLVAKASGKLAAVTTLEEVFDSIANSNPVSPDVS